MATSIDEMIYEASVLIGLAVFLSSPLAAWKGKRKLLRMNAALTAAIAVVGLYFALQMPSQNYNYDGARGIFTVLLVVVALCAFSLGLSWVAANRFRSKQG